MTPTDALTAALSDDLLVNALIVAQPEGKPLGHSGGLAAMRAVLVPALLKAAEVAPPMRAEVKREALLEMREFVNGFYVGKHEIVLYLDEKLAALAAEAEPAENWQARSLQAEASLRLLRQAIDEAVPTAEAGTTPCEWTPHKTSNELGGPPVKAWSYGLPVWESGCANEATLAVANISGWTFCPYCGHPLTLKETP